MAPVIRRAVLAAVGLVVCGATLARAQGPENVLLVVNTASAASKEIAAHYAKVRAIPDEQIVRLELPDADLLTRAEYQSRIEQPLGEWLATHSAHDRILYIVLTKGVPLRVDGSSGKPGTGASVDSELTLLYRKLTGAPVPPQGSIVNPYYLGTAAVAAAKRFTHREQDIYLVTRLDGFTVADVIALIDRGASPSNRGAIVLDQKADLPARAGESWLQTAADTLRAQGFDGRTILETTTRPYTSTEPVLGYFSWGSNDRALRTRGPGLTFSPGAIGAMLLSSDARTFREPPAAWVPGDWQRRETYFAGSPESLTGDLVRAGITGAAGYVSDPFTDGAVRPEVLFPAYLAGFNLAESFYLATPVLSWQSVVVGDPLCAPFPHERASTDDVHGSLDPTTELPLFFSERRLTVLSVNGISREAVQSFMRAEARWARDDTAGARVALEAATAREPRLGTAQMMLSSLYEKSGDYDLAIERYRTILTFAPDNALALNNLAYGLAVHRHEPLDALPLARRAYALLPAVTTADTLGWILHLTGETTSAALLFGDILRTPVDNAEILLHAATVFASVQRPDDALAILNRAVALDPTLENREPVKQLRAKVTPSRKKGSD